MLEQQPAEQLELQLLLDAIYLRYGYDFRKYARDSIGRRVQAAAAKVGARHLGELQHRVLSEPDTFNSILDVLTVRVTEMFRDPDFYRALKQLVVPVLRTCRSPIPAASRASVGMPIDTSFDATTSACVAIAPTVSVALSSRMPRSSAIAPRSTSAGGRASRNLRVGTRLWPPASGRAPSAAATISAKSSASR